MRGIRLAAAASATALLAAAAPAHARNVDYRGTLHVSGGVTIGWHGDPARGCAAAGLCGYAGSISIRPDDSDYQLRVNGRGRPVDGFVSLDLFDSPPLVRVKRTEPGGEEGACVDSSPIEYAELAVSRAGGRRVHLGLSAPGLSPGRCAGPRLAQLLTRLPRRTESVSRLTRGGASVDFSGAFPYKAGRFSGTVRSTLRVSFEKPGRDVPRLPGQGPGRPPRRPLVRVVRVHALYRVTGFRGALTTQFGGLADPPCAEFDSCGVSGSGRWEVAAQGGTVALDGQALARRTDHGLRGGLAAIQRPGSFVFGESGLGRASGTTSADVTRPGGAPCHDTATARSAGLGAFDSGRRLVFELAGEYATPAPVDLLRTGCPGPRDEDLIGFDFAAHGSVPLGALGRRSLGVKLGDSASFSAHGYSGSRLADFSLELSRISIHATYRRARGIG